MQFRFYIIAVSVCVLLYVSGSFCTKHAASTRDRHIFLREHVLDTTTHSESANTLDNGNFYSSWLPSFVGRRFSLRSDSTEDADADRVHTYLFHYDPSTLKDTKAALEAVGVQVGHYVPHNSFIGTATKSQAAAAKQISGMQWVGDYRPEFKMPNDARVRGHLAHHTRIHNEELSKAAQDAAHRMTETAEANANSAAASNNEIVGAGAPFGVGQRSLLEATTASTVESVQQPAKDVEPHFTVFAHIARRNELTEVRKLASEWEEQLKTAIGSKLIALVAAAKDKVAAGVIGADSAHKVSTWLTEVGHVHWVEIKPQTITHNKFAARLVQSFEQATPLWDIGIHGEGEVIGVGDTGMDTFTCFFYDEANPVPYQSTAGEKVTSTHRKVEGFWKFMDGIDSELGHGTHVSGTAAGSVHPTLAVAGLSDYNSASYGARIAFMDCGCDTDAGCPCPTDTPCECDVKEGKKCDRRFGVVYLPLSLSEGYFPWHYTKGARVVSNSWGTGYYRDFTFGYSTSSAEIDDFVWQHKDFLPVFASGNSGGQFGYASLTSEAESKNALAVGASQSSLASFQNVHVNFTDFTVLAKRIQFELQQAYCPEESEYHDAALCTQAQAFNAASCCDTANACNPISESCCGTQVFPQHKTIGFRCCSTCIAWEMEQVPAHFNQNNLALFTARGPALDGRIKPDIVTVGDTIMSARSFGTQEAKKCANTNSIADSLLKHEGTSMAAPVAASAAVLVRQYFRKGYHPTASATRANEFDPSAAMVKAVLIHSAQLLTGLIRLASKNLWYPIQYKPGQRYKLRSPYLQGFGRIELQKALGPNTGLYLPNIKDRPINTGDIHEYCFQVGAAKPFKITLVWTDPASTPAAQINLVNDIDLIVVEESGTVSFGNGKNSVIGSARNEPDYLNNVEQVEFNPVAAGKYNVVVRGTNIPQGPQPYALIISGDGLSITKRCAVVDLTTNPQLATYKSLSMVFGLTSVILVPLLMALAVYFFLQHRAVTTTRRGFRQAHMGDSDAGEYMQLETELPAAPATAT